MSSKESVIEALNWLGTVSTRFRPKTSEVIDKGLSIATSFEALSARDRISVQEGLPPLLHKKLFALSGFMAEAAINERDPKWIEAAVCLHLLEDFGVDYRENFRYLVLVTYAAKKINIDFKEVIERVLPIASMRSKSYLLDFSGRSDSVNSLSSFGIKEEIFGNKSQFVPV
ncbi:hypothetical protein [Dyella sp. S184]|uniref:hypothetical protein n=1 Tax=Dyella sp. S184 TaxID=1641862 RepID=UPI00131BB57B|nr:hypothetical protein [Dyella sp. S184]